MEPTFFIEGLRLYSQLGTTDESCTLSTKELIDTARLFVPETIIPKPDEVQSFTINLRKPTTGFQKPFLFLCLPFLCLPRQTHSPEQKKWTATIAGTPERISGITKELTHHTLTVQEGILHSATGKLQDQSTYSSHRTDPPPIMSGKPVKLIPYLYKKVSSKLWFITSSKN